MGNFTYSAPFKQIEWNPNNPVHTISTHTMNTFLMHIANCPSAAYEVIFSLFTPHLPSVTINNTKFCCVSCLLFLILAVCTVYCIHYYSLLFLSLL